MAVGAVRAAGDLDGLEALRAGLRGRFATSAFGDPDGLARAMEGALARIRPEYREVVILRYQEGLTHPEIAEILGLPSGTVKTYLHRARKELATLLKPFA